MDLGVSRRGYGYDRGAATLYMFGIILVPFLIFMTLAGAVVAFVPAEQRQDGGGAIRFLLLLLCFGSLLVGGYSVWFLRVAGTDRVALFTVFDNGLAYGHVADPFTMRLAAPHSVLIPWFDITELRERGPGSSVLRALLPPGRRYRLDIVTRDHRVLTLTGAIQNARELATVLRSHVG
ncbi:hypothetical protein ACWT_4593 [Actinoplanes sp. SE50]|uniref:hypothetical protein n=1 Tax=unclassified Actinoplanes TaxID=2626549 RepID=UPI00023ED477|nr:MULTISPECIES: hypothetical protein [unclassified Actinoplanes]AEV85615.1 hypothetical protein ACPL_4724 [Actinoplanes sp. SE50/110]ATO84008.1 hypothetical protein ACWT_4593 [Actinoplanes sp. SE50]SLM01418.1 hypothetical protein ACSP50_4654 [Actinoplanes sp. SE50/110]